MNTPTAIAAVFARGGSKGVPDKNLRELNGVPLVAIAVRQAAAVHGINRVVVSTDSEQIAEVARDAGGEVPWLRPDELASDTAREWDAWQHLVRWLDDRGETPAHLLVVPCTAPLREVSDLQRCLDEATATGADIVLSITEAHRNPWFNMVALDESGNARLVNEPPARIHRRQDAPKVFDVGTVAFVARPDYVRTATSLYDGTVRGVEVPAERSLDIDTEVDFAFAELLLSRRNPEDP